MNLLNYINLVQVTLKAISILKLLIIIDITVVIVEKISFKIGKQMILVIENNGFPLYKKSLIWSILKRVKEYLWLIYKK